MEGTSLLGEPASEQRRVRVELRGVLGLGVHVHGFQGVVSPGVLVLTHELGGLNRVRPHVHRLRRRNQHRNARCGILDRVLRRAPEQAARLGAVTQRVRTPREDGVACQQVHVPDGKTAVGHGTVGKLIEVDLLVQVLTCRKHLDGTLSALGAEAVAEVVGGVFLRAGQRTRQHRNLVEQSSENQTEITDVTCGDVANLVANDEAQRLRVTRLTANLEQVGVQADVAAEAVTCRESVHHAVTEDDVRIRHAAQTRRLSCFGEHLVRLRELGRGDAHTANTLLRVVDCTNDKDGNRAQDEQANRLENQVFQARGGAAGRYSNRAFTG